MFRKFYILITLISFLFIAIFINIRNSDNEISYDRFNIVAPGVLRTPEENFVGLKDFPYEPHYLMIGDTRIHYLDEGPDDGDIIFLLHGEPAWSYLFRKDDSNSY